MTKKILLAFLGVLLLLGLYYRSLIVYGVGQGLGQLKIIREARPVAEFLNDPAFPDSLKVKLELIARARQFAIDSLGLHDTDNYKTLYDQKGQEIMWVVMACEPFRLVAKQWDFPVVGSFPYKGYFSKEKALREREQLEKENYDVSIRNPSGWSTLGWFTEPILSGMLNRSEGNLASLIIHEMVHATIFVKDSAEFNENLASFIGDRGAEIFLERMYGDTSRQYREYLHEDQDYRKVAEHMLLATSKLDSLYGTMTDQESVASKKERKEAFILKIIEAMDTLSLKEKRKQSRRFRNRLPNNTYFMSFKTYESKHDSFMDEWTHQFHENLKLMIREYQKRYPYL